MPNAKGRLAEAYTGSSGSKTTDLGFGYSARGDTTDAYESTPHSGGYYHVAASYWPTGMLETLNTNVSGLPTWSYTPGGEGRLGGITASSGQSPVTSAGYNTASQPTTVTFGSGDNDSFTYDSNTGRMTQYQYEINGSYDVDTLTWNANGTLQGISIYDELITNSSQNDSQVCTNTYDDLARLINNNCGNAWQQSFSYDSFGNISFTGSDAFQPTYYESSNQFQTLPAGSPKYDANGNLTSDGFNHYTWDAEGRNTSVNGGSTTIVYDALGRWVEQDGSQTKEALYSPTGDKLGLMNGTALQLFHLSLPGGAIASYTSAGLTNYLHADWLGSTRLVTTPSRTAVAAQSFSPFGLQYNPLSADAFYTGVANLNEEGSGVLTFPARNQEPSEGRWLAPDPAGLSAVDPTDPQTFNRYAYVRNNPLGLVDPTGTCPGANQFNCPGAPTPATNISAYTGLINQAMYNSSNDLAYGSDLFQIMQTPSSVQNFEAGSYYVYGNTVVDSSGSSSNWLISTSSQPSQPPNTGTPEKPIDWHKIGSCLVSSTLNHYGLTAAAGASSLLAIPISKALVPPYRVIGTPTTNLLSVLGHYAEITVPRMLESTNLLRIAGRANPYVAGALLAIDVGMISYDTYQCYQQATPSAPSAPAPQPATGPGGPG